MTGLPEHGELIPDLADQGERPHRGDEERSVDPCREVCDVARRGSWGTGAALGFKYLSSGFIVQLAEVAELVDPLRPLISSSPICVGTSRTLIGCPGSRGQEVVDGSAGLWYSMSPSSWYCEYLHVNDSHYQNT